MTMRILLVDPDDAFSRLAARFFVEHRDEVVLAASADEACEKAASSPPDAVVTELSLADDGDGTALIARLRESGAAVPVIAYARRAAADDIVRAVDAGADAVLVKSRDPVVQFPALLRRIHAVCRRRNEERNACVRDVLEGISQSVFEVSDDGSILHANRHASMVFGTQPENLQGTALRSLIAPDDRDRFTDHLWWAKNREESGEGEYRAVRGDGSLFWTLFSFSRVLSAGAPGLRCVAVDITRRKEMEKALLENEERLNLAIESANFYIWDWDLETGAIQSTGHGGTPAPPPFEQMQGQVELIEGLIHSDDLPGLMKRAQRHFVERTPNFEARFRVRGEDGSWRWIQMRGRIIARDDRGHPAKMTGIYHDVTDEVNRERFTREQAAQFRTLFYNMNCGGAIFKAVDGGRDFVVTDINYAGEMIEGRKKHTLAGRGIRELYRGEELSLLYEAMLQVWRTGKPRQVDRLLFTHGKAHQWREYYFYYLPTGEMIAIYNDITDLVNRQKAMLSSLKVKETLIKEIHHRVKNNLQVIASILKLQAMRTEDPGAIDALRDCRNRVFSIAMIHEELYRSDNLARIRVAEYIRHLGEHLIYEFLAVSPPVSLTVDCDEALELDIDTGIPCGLIIDELVTNALKYAFEPGQHGSIRISFAREGDDYLLRVRDNGRGFPREIDFRSTDTLGMQLVTNLTEQLSGTVGLLRERGTEFVIRFPVPGTGTLR
ncbi:MAG: PAS domain S-box protein [Methanomicrobiales archaeon]|nr:PAS domain S-box protein [Methanomicrobiales archaeon]